MNTLNVNNIYVALYIDNIFVSIQIGRTTNLRLKIEEWSV